MEVGLKNKTAVVSLSLERCKQSSGTTLYQLSGNNTGNLLFTAAIYSQLKNAELIMGQDKPDELRNRYDQICIPAANWIYPKFDFGWLAEILEKSRLPVCCVGLGAQIDASQVGNLTPGTLRLLHVLSDRSTRIGVRGSQTADLMNKLGIKNVEVLGCPSLFQAFGIPKIEFPEPDTAWAVGGSFTRFVLSPGREDQFQQKLARYLFRVADRIYFQSEIEEIRFLAKESSVSRALANFYLQPTDVVEATLKRKGRCFNNLDDWIDDLKDCSVFFSSRIHGCVASVLAGRPAILLTHDVRTRELAESMALANFPIENVKFDDLEAKDWVLKISDSYRDAEQIWAINRLRLIDFYRCNNVPIIDVNQPD